MAKRIEIDPATRIWLIEECLAGRMRGSEAARRAGVSPGGMRNWIHKYRSNGAAAFEPVETPQKYSAEVKQKVIKDYLAGKGSAAMLSEKYHISCGSLVNDWINKYNRHKGTKQGTGGLSMTTRKSTLEERIHAVKECTDEGKSYTQVAEQTGFSYRQIYEWVKKYKEFGVAGLEDRRGERKINQTPRSKEEELALRIAQLEHENHLLKLERDLLKKVKELERGNL